MRYTCTHITHITNARTYNTYRTYIRINVHICHTYIIHILYILHIIYILNIFYICIFINKKNT